MTWREEAEKRDGTLSDSAGAADWRAAALARDRAFNPDWEGANTARTAGLYETPTGRPTAEMQIPEPASGSGAGFLANLKSNMAEDPETRMRLLAESRFPDDPNARERFGTMNARPVFMNDRGQPEYADAGLASRAGKFLANAPEMIGSALGAGAGSHPAAAAATGGASPYAGSVLGSVGGRGLKRILSALVFDEPQTTAGNVASLGEEALVSSLGAGAVKAGATAYNRAAIRNADKFDLPQARALQERIKASTGIELDFAQAGNIPQLRALKKWASKYPSDAQEIIQALDAKQAGQVGGAITDKVLKALGREQDPSLLAGAGVNAARSALEMAKLQREAAAKPLYQKAYGDSVDKTTLAQIKKADPVIAGSMRRVMGNPLYKRDLAGATEDSIRALDLVKRDLDDQIETAIKGGERNRARILTKTKEDLLTFLDASSPSYKAARQKYAELSKSVVEPLEGGAVGILAKIEGPAMVRQVAGLMNDILANPQAVKGLRVALTNQQGTGAWNNLVKLSLAKKFDKAALETQGGDVVNLAGKFRQAVIGTPERAKAMDEALDPAVRPVFNDLMDSLQLIAREARARGGSDTAFNTEITKMQKGGAFASLGRLITAPAKTVREALDEKVLEKNAVAFAEALTDQKKLTALKELRKMRPSTERALAILSVVGIGGSANAVGQSVISPAPVDAPPRSAGRAGATQSPSQVRGSP